MDLTYRWNIFGHDKSLQALEHDIANSHLAHAYLFAGPHHIGKFGIAQNFAKILQCPNNFCGVCSTCIQIEKGYHPDTILVADDGESIKIDKIREILSQLYLSAQSPFRILLIKNVERMTVESANALLKTLEDPPGNVKFLFTTGNVKELPTTILSRMRLMKLYGVSETDMQKFLGSLDFNCSAEDLEAIIALSDGKIGKALQFLKDPELLKYFKTMYSQLNLLSDQPDLVESFIYVSNIVKEDHSTQDFLQVFLAVLRNRLLKKLADGSAVTIIEKDILLIQNIQQAQEMLKRNVNARLVLENIMLAL